MFEHVHGLFLINFGQISTEITADHNFDMFLLYLNCQQLSILSIHLIARHLSAGTANDIAFYLKHRRNRTQHMKFGYFYLHNGIFVPFKNIHAFHIVQ